MTFVCANEWAGNVHILLDYLYRDASNFKSFGSVEIRDGLSEAERSELHSCLESGEFFIAEQVGLPPLYRQLEKYGGDGRDDHSWHTLLGFREVPTIPSNVETAVDGLKLLQSFRMAGQNWRPELSPNFASTYL